MIPRFLSSYLWLRCQISRQLHHRPVSYHNTYQNQVVLTSLRTSPKPGWFSVPRKCSRSYKPPPPELDPNKTSRRQKLMLATYVSGTIGVILLGVIGLRYYRRMAQRASGIEEIKVKELSFGRRAELFKYRGYVFSSFFLNKLREIHMFDVREDDVWVVTFPKAGTTWVQEIVYLLMNDIDFEKASKINIEHRFPYFEYPMPGLDVIAETPSPRLIKSHLPFSILPNQMDKKKPKTIYVARNPKDTIVSYYWFGIKFLNVVPFNGSFEDYCRLFVTGQVSYGPWWKHVTEAWKRKDDENMLFLFYEDLQTDARKCVKQIAEFLGKSFTEEQLDLVVQHCNFDSMKKNRSVNYEWMKDDGIANKDEAFLRSGKVGDWRNHLSEDIMKQVDEIVATKLPADMREYIRDSLPEK